MAKKKNVTFDDIAKYTNFSKTTISRYFNDIDSLTLENQQIISDALVELNYKENKVARILANGKTEFVGILIPNLYLHYYSQVLNQILSQERLTMIQTAIPILRLRFPLNPSARRTRSLMK